FISFSSTSFVFSSSAAHRALHSFPTRRSSDLVRIGQAFGELAPLVVRAVPVGIGQPGDPALLFGRFPSFCRIGIAAVLHHVEVADRKSTRLNSSHVKISYAVFCLKKKKTH